jgi:hypothetical protein
VIPLLLLSAFPLFDGQTTQGWRAYLGEQFPSKHWEIRDGALCAKPGSYLQPDLATSREFQNFDLTFEWRVAKAGNSGVFYRARPAGGGPQGWLLRRWGKTGLGLALEYQILDDPHHPDGRDPKTSVAALYNRVAPPANKPRKQAGEWNTGRIRVQGRRTEHWLNGEKVLEADLPEEFCIGSPILLQHHGSRACYRNLRITPFE